MTAGLFTPIGEKPRWELIYDALARLDVGDIVTYDQLADAVDVTRAEFLRNRPGWYKAQQRWGEDHKRALRPVNGVGYRVVDAAEHEAIAKVHHKKSKRQLRRSRQVLSNADRSRLNEEQRQRFDRMEATIGRHEDLIRRLDGRTQKVEKAVAESKQKHDVTEARIAALEEALQRHGINPETAA